MKVTICFLLVVATAIAQNYDNFGQPIPKQNLPLEAFNNPDGPYVALQILVPKALESINRRQDYVQALWKQVQELQQYDPPPSFNQGRFLEWILKLMQNN